MVSYETISVVNDTFYTIKTYIESEIVEWKDDLVFNTFIVIDKFLLFTAIIFVCVLSKYVCVNITKTQTF